LETIFFWPLSPGTVEGVSLFAMVPPLRLGLALGLDPPGFHEGIQVRDLVAYRASADLHIGGRLAHVTAHLQGSVGQAQIAGGFLFSEEGLSGIHAETPFVLALREHPRGHLFSTEYDTARKNINFAGQLRKTKFAGGEMPGEWNIQ